MVPQVPLFQELVVEPEDGEQSDVTRIMSDNHELAIIPHDTSQSVQGEERTPRDEESRGDKDYISVHRSKAMLICNFIWDQCEESRQRDCMMKEKGNELSWSCMFSVVKIVYQDLE
jgi:hypothetical protein